MSVGDHNHSDPAPLRRAPRAPADEPPALQRLLDAAAADRAAAAEERRLATRERRRVEEYLTAAYRDPVTGALNRRPGEEQLAVEIERAHRTGTTMAVIFLDVDGLKLVNDRFGHRRGDEVLAATADALCNALRPYDIVIRWGGDEFVCALPSGTAEVAQARLVQALRVLATRVPGATFSAGHAQLLAQDTLADVVNRADANLYRRRSDRSAAGPTSLPRQTVPAGIESTVTCGACKVAIPLSRFRFSGDDRMTRHARCQRCHRETIIQLSVPSGTDESSV